MYKVRSKTNSNVSKSCERISYEVVLLNIKFLAILSADILLAAFFIGLLALLVYIPQKLIHLQPLPDFFISKGQNLAFSLSPSLLELLTVNLF